MCYYKIRVPLWKYQLVLSATFLIVTCSVRGFRHYGAENQLNRNFLEHGSLDKAQSNYQPNFVASDRKALIQHKNNQTNSARQNAESGQLKPQEPYDDLHAPLLDEIKGDEIISSQNEVHEPTKYSNEGASSNSEQEIPEGIMEDITNDEDGKSENERLMQQNGDQDPIDDLPQHNGSHKTYAAAFDPLENIYAEEDKYDRFEVMGIYSPHGTETDYWDEDGQDSRPADSRPCSGIYCDNTPYGQTDSTTGAPTSTRRPNIVGLPTGTTIQYPRTTRHPTEAAADFAAATRVKPLEQDDEMGDDQTSDDESIITSASPVVYAVSAFGGIGLLLVGGLYALQEKFFRSRIQRPIKSDDTFSSLGEKNFECDDNFSDG